MRDRRHGGGRVAFAVALFLLLTACASRPPAVPMPTPAPEPAPERPVPSFVQKGMASWYGPRFHGRRTASGERFDQNALTAAHRTLPMGTIATVRDPETGRSVRVRINDRGPYARGRIIDLSRAAARRLGIVARGVAPVVVEVWPETGGEVWPETGGEVRVSAR